VSEPLVIGFTRRATRHVDEALRWWSRNRSKAPDALAEDLEGALSLILSQPNIGAIARNVRLRGVRRIYLDRVRYYLYYRVRGSPPASIEVVALWHVSRGSVPPI
jgi:plasmid stabilization system protein ParE